MKKLSFIFAAVVAAVIMSCGTGNTDAVTVCDSCDSCDSCDTVCVDTVDTVAVAVDTVA